MSYVKIWIHAVWGTKNREPVLKPTILHQLCSHIVSNAKGKGIYIDSMNGHDEHVHILMLLKAENSISKQIQLLKGESSRWANQTGLIKGGLCWAEKYFAASVSENKIDMVRTYIKNQEEHHRKQTFEIEYKRFLKSLGYEQQSD